MPKGIPNGETCRYLSNYKDGKYLLHFTKAKLENGCWNKQIPDKQLKKGNGEIIGHEKLGGVYQEKGRARYMAEVRCLRGKGSINWKCSFRGWQVNGSIGNAFTLDLKSKSEKSTQMAAAAPMDKANGETRQKRANDGRRSTGWYMVCGLILQTANLNLKLSGRGSFFRIAGGGRADRAGPDGAKGPFFVTLQPIKKV